MITTRAACAMGVADHALNVGVPANLVVLDAPDVLEAPREHAVPVAVVSGAASWTSRACVSWRAARPAVGGLVLPDPGPPLPGGRQVVAVQVRPSPSRPHYLERNEVRRRHLRPRGLANRRDDRELIEELRRFARGEALDELPCRASTRKFWTSERLPSGFQVVRRHPQACGVTPRP